MVAKNGRSRPSKIIRSMYNVPPYFLLCSSTYQYCLHKANNFEPGKFIYLDLENTILIKCVLNQKFNKDVNYIQIHINYQYR